VIFKAFDRNDFANRIEKNVFFDEDDSLNWVIDAFTKRRWDLRQTRESSERAWDHLT
jgi:hypothetical protein